MRSKDDEGVKIYAQEKVKKIFDKKAENWDQTSKNVFRACNDSMLLGKVKQFYAHFLLLTFIPFLYF